MVMYSNIFNSRNIENLFEQNLELKDIGPPKSYLKYLDTIFPNSKLKDILCHGSRNPEKFEEFDINKRSGGNHGRGFYFTPELNRAKRYTRQTGHVITAVVNIETPVITSLKWKDWFGVLMNFPSDKTIADYVDAADSVLDYQGIDRNNMKKFNEYIVEYVGKLDEMGKPVFQEFNEPYIGEVVVLNPQNIHILSSKKDKQLFEKYMIHNK